MTPLPCPRCLMWDAGRCEHPDPTARLPCPLMGRGGARQPAEPGDDAASVEGWRAMMAGSPAYTPDLGEVVPCPGFVPMETT